MLQALDKATGKALWSGELPCRPVASPMTYMHQGQQYVVIAVGGGQSGGARGIRIAGDSIAARGRKGASAPHSPRLLALSGGAGSVTLTPDTKIGGYEVVALLGQGGMGEVYRATDTKAETSGGAQDPAGGAREPTAIGWRGFSAKPRSWRARITRRSRPSTGWRTPTTLRRSSWSWSRVKISPRG